VKTATVDSTVTVVWWMPTEFWDMAVATNSAVTSQAIAKLHTLMDDYVVFAISRGRVTVDGLLATPREEMLRVSVCEASGQRLIPLATTDVKPEVQALVTTLKPIFGTLLGGFGQSLEFVFYPNPLQGQRLIDARRDGTLKFTLSEQTFTWRLPLGSLLPPKHDASTGEDFPGNYQYNPYTGNRLMSR
jgi:hypothetical protein